MFMRVVAEEETVISKDVYLMYKNMGLNDHETARAMGLPYKHLQRVYKREWGLNKTGRNPIVLSDAEVSRLRRKYIGMKKKSWDDIRIAKHKTYEYESSSALEI
ncbi:hypothetical protein [Priestia megaterium]|uniref:hypothetical protein n=1 Tax=Priestia megaterium TaxID=1404 RepID=UPI000BF60729|nr:hypothetical protein [Priestia megaterium]PFI93383.1 hypothetical protein COI84_19650 [Priestia megaterium]PGR11800.1 hypothetical protein COC62_14350 [Priestia megaterium]